MDRQATVYLFRPFQSAAQQAQRAGVPPQKAIDEVREAQRRGEVGNHIAGKYRALAWANQWGESGGAA